MAEFRALLERLGCSDVATYLQSGNAVVTSKAKAATLAAHVHEELGVDVLIRTAAQLAQVTAGNPFSAEAANDPTKVAVAFLSEQPEQGRYDAIDHAAFIPDEVRLGDQVLYLHYPNGQGRAALKPATLAGLKVTTTVRNWRTVEALTRMSSA